jgi:hypothetical protein
LTVNGSLVRSQVCRQANEAGEACDEWQAAMRGDGWT